MILNLIDNTLKIILTKKDISFKYLIHILNFYFYKLSTNNMTFNLLARKLYIPFKFIFKFYRNYRFGTQALNWNDFVLGGELLISMNIPKGNFLIDPRSHLMRSAFVGKYEEKTMKLLSSLEIKDGIIVNIGANIGFFSVHLANLFPKNKIIAIEPNPEAFDLLKKNISLNNLSSNIECVNVCISDKSGSIPFTIIPGKSEYSSIGSINFDVVQHDIRKIIQVDSKRLNDLVYDKKLELIFMDVEGAEDLVIKGSVDLISKYRPIIISECADLFLPKFNSNAKKFIERLTNLNYTVLNAENPNKKISFPFNGNIIALPKKNKL